MNKFLTRIAIGGSIILTLLLVVQITGCAKDKPCKADITVLDPNNNPVSGAIVHLYVHPPTTSTVSYESTTDASGKASFTVNLPQILDIDVITAGPTTTVTGKVARFEQGKTDAVTVTAP